MSITDWILLAGIVYLALGIGKISYRWYRIYRAKRAARRLAKTLSVMFSTPSVHWFRLDK